MDRRWVGSGQEAGSGWEAHRRAYEAVGRRQVVEEHGAPLRAACSFVSSESVVSSEQ